VRTAQGALLCAAVAGCGPAAAHGFGARYDLPIPLTYYLTGAALAVLLSFIVAGVSLRGPGPRPQEHGSGYHDLPGVLPVARCFGVAVYILVVISGFVGVQAPLKNIAPVFVWAIAWVGLSYLSAYVGNVWAMLNPFDAVFAWAERIASRTRSAVLRYPERLGVWPAVVLFVGFVWMEIVWEDSDHPAYLALALIAYGGFTWVAMALYGRKTWLQHGEVFSLVFGLLARFAPIDVRVQPVKGRDRLAMQLRPYARGLLVREPLARSQVLLVMVLLSSVSFDGFVETPAWLAAMTLTDRPVLLKTLALILAPCVFLVVFLFVCRLSAAFAAAPTQAPVATWRMAGLFATTLVPIAIAYHLAHYLSFLAMAGQYLIPLLSDPLGRGWDLFGTVNHFVRPGVVDARLVWNVSVAAIVVGHVAAIYLAHLQALQEFPSRHDALRSQYPMLALMLGYTMLSLWIIAQPIVATR